jgi:L-amino acid N-acyltransferase YncA
VKIRKAAPADALGIAKVHVDSWKTTYANIIPEEYFKKITYENREQLWKEEIPKGGVFVAENEEGQIIGFSSGGKERSGKYPEYPGELYAIYILKEHQGKGIGTLLVKPIIEELRQQNINAMLVVVLEDNSSRHFYEALGGKKIDTIEAEFSGKRLNELIYGWDDIKSIHL